VHNEIDLAWLAGIMDGEGTMGMYHSHYKNRNRNLPDISRISVDIQIPNTNILIMKECQRIVSSILNFNINILEKIPDARVHRRVSYMICITGIKNIIKFLVNIESFLVGKKDQALILLSILKNHVNNLKLTKDEFKVIQQLKDIKESHMETIDGVTKVCNNMNYILNYEQLELSI
jgi:hypothetical protein